MKVDYISRDDALNEIHRFRGYIDEDMEYRMKSAFNKIPSADVEEMVRCKDCSHGHKTSYPSELRICLTTGCAHSENHFCSDGKRRDGGT